MNKLFFGIRLFVSAVILLCFTAVYGQYDPVERWGKTIAQFGHQDSVSAPKPGGILMLGSSSFTIWKDVSTYFSGKEIINRGFGGSQMSDVLFFKEKLILPYSPKQIWLYEGENDITSGKTPDAILNEIKQLVQWTKEKYPKISFILISMKPSPSRWELRETMLEMNRKLKAFAQSDKHMKFVDIWNPLLGPDGKPVNGNYLDDLLHLNANGYKIWHKAMLPALK